ncbi:MAG TPA: hypothetical protein VGE12_03425 [Noviherbaspirillum sp.]
MLRLRFTGAPWRRSLLRGAGVAALVLCAVPVAAESLVRKALAHAYGYEQLAILYPGDRLTVFDNDGEIDVYVIAMPRDAIRPGDRVELLLDDWPVPASPDKAFILRNVAKGSHRLRARIVGTDGFPIAESRPVWFYKWHALRESSDGDEVDR